MQIEERFAIAEYMREEWSDFRVFAEAGMQFLGFDLTEMQDDIAEFMDSGPRLRMVMAQRGEAKSTLAALYAVWRLIRRPQDRVLVVSGGERQASEVARLIIQLIMQWDMLEYLRPDRTAGDRTAADGFDVHWLLKGPEKSPSVACVGITAALQGKRADLLISDDIETTKNGLTVAQREMLALLTREFSSICTHGDILYLGTPQTKDSVYNALESRGFTIRIWPGRFPTPDEVEKYGDRLAPFLADRIRADPSLQRGGGIDGSRGQAADPQRYDEHALVEKELDQGPEGFQLQFMLDTSLADAARQQLKLEDLMVANFDSDMLPEFLVYQAAPRHLVELGPNFPVHSAKMYHPVIVDNCQYRPRKEVAMFIDPAGNGGDELAFAVGCSIGPYIHVLDVGGVKGGLNDENGELFVSLVQEFDIKDIRVESNMGHGLFEINLRGILDKAGLKDVGITGEYSTGQKERRIIDSLVSAMQRHKVVLHKRVLESDEKYGKQHSIDKRKAYSMFYQLANITTDRNSLTHEDRLEAMAGMVRIFKEVLAQDEDEAARKRKEAEALEHSLNPMGYTRSQMNAMPPARGTRRAVERRRY